MHELSIAEALREIAVQHAPPGTVIRKVVVRAGPLRGIDPDAMQLAWQSATAGHPLQGAILDLRLLPWSMRCATCERTWAAADAYDSCTCGNDRPNVLGGDDLVLESLDVDDNNGTMNL